jgi:tetratricopeptide (TPR) repeat protein
MVKKDYKSGAAAIRKAIRYKDATDICYQMLGSLYDYDGQPEKALNTFDEGLKRFPGSGRLWLEKGNVYWIQRKYEEALPNYEKGIAADPKFPSNYYRLALLFLNSEQKVWGMIYGEIFMNLERNSDRTDEISKLLYKTYKSQISFRTDSSVSVSFTKKETINLSLNDLKNPEELKLPFGSMIYEPVLLLAIAGEKEINPISLERIRKRFAMLYFENNHFKKYPNILFSYHKTLAENDLFEAYSMWITREGDGEIFNSWVESNGEKWDKFADWFNANPFPVSLENYFVRGQY